MGVNKLFRSASMTCITLYYCLFCFINGRAQVSLETDTLPGLINGASFIYHPQSNALLLAGGMKVIPDTVNSDVWKWDGIKWKKIIAAGPGSIDFSQGIALNSNTGEITGIGGYDMFDDSKDAVWSFNGKNWINKGESNVGNRIHHAMVYAVHLKSFVLYGGFDENRDDDSATWLMKGGVLVNCNIPGPGPRHQFSMTYDKKRKKVVLYGGSERSDELWEFDGLTWKRIQYADGPGARMRHRMIYDDNLKMVILHGGDPRGSLMQTTWGWNGTTWMKIAEANFFPIGIGYDEKRKAVVAYATSGSSLGVWELKEKAWIRVADYGNNWSSSAQRKLRMEKKPDDVIPMIQAAFDFRFNKKFAEAETLYKKIEKVFPAKISLLTNITHVLLMQNKFEEVGDYLSKIDRAGLKKRYQCERLAAYLSQAKKYDEASKYYEKAVQLQNRQDDLVDLGRMYALTGNREKAFEILNKATESGNILKKDFENNASFTSLKTDSRWEKLVSKLK